MLRNTIYKLTFVFALFITALPVIAEGLKPFMSGSYAQILEQHKQKPFILVLWSVDCPPCHKELEMLGKLVAKNQKLNIVLVSTDSEVESNEVSVIMGKYKVNKLESWIFRGESDQALRYEIDRRWYGELPRSYLFKPTGEKQIVSGVLAEEKLLAWLKQ